MEKGKLGLCSSWMESRQLWWSAREPRRAQEKPPRARLTCDRLGSLSGNSLENALDGDGNAFSRLHARVCAALCINSFPVAEAEIFCSADRWSLAVGKAQSVPCLHGVSARSGKSVCCVGPVAVSRPPADHLHSGPGKRQACKGRRENVLPCLAFAMASSFQRDAPALVG